MTGARSLLLSDYRTKDTFCVFWRRAARRPGYTLPYRKVSPTSSQQQEPTIGQRDPDGVAEGISGGSRERRF